MCRAACSNFAPTLKAPYHNPVFQKDKTVLVYCASGGLFGVGRARRSRSSAFAGYNIGGFKKLADAGLGTEPAAVMVAATRKAG
jgi:rhodanese-related sulfurtransferase